MAVSYREILYKQYRHLPNSCVKEVGVQQCAQSYKGRRLNAEKVLARFDLEINNVMLEVKRNKARKSLNCKR